MKEILIINSNKIALIDDEDYELVARHNWYEFNYNTVTYVKALIDGEFIGMHSIVMPPTLNTTVDHKDHNGLNNQKNNLRLATKSQQNSYRQKFSNNTSGYKGVVYEKSRNAWKATITKDQKTKFLGRFKTVTGAAKAYNIAALEFFGEFAVLNTIPEKEVKIN